jgi:excisionase family DNA binding protein
VEFISVKDAALLWNISERRVQKLCADKRIQGVQRFGKSWMIPKDAVKPTDPRKAHAAKDGD